MNLACSTEPQIEVHKRVTSVCPVILDVLLKHHTGGDT